MGEVGADPEWYCLAIRICRDVISMARMWSSFVCVQRQENGEPPWFLDERVFAHEWVVTLRDVGLGAVVSE